MGKENSIYLQVVAAIRAFTCATVSDAEAARVYMESKRWPDGAVCPACAEAKRITTRKDGFYRCNACKTDFTVRTGTIFERSHIPLHKWVYAMYLLVTARKGISSLQLAKQIGVTQKSAWFMLQRLREACGNDPSVLSVTRWTASPVSYLPLPARASPTRT